jgi:NADH-quinone oxidoreductase subunit F
MLDLLTKITDGDATMEDLDKLYELSEMVAETALCGLGESAPNPVLTTIKYFRDEYEAHIIEKRCPAGVCDKIISSPCKHTCPVGTDVSAYMGYLAKEDFKHAAEAIRLHNPLPNVCARVCSRPCETRCRSGEWGDPISVRRLKRFALDWERSNNGVPKPPGKKSNFKESVGILGSGPAGLMAAFELAQYGYNVTVYEAKSVAGGMLATGVPEYRLPKEILEHDLDYIKRAGVNIVTDCKIGKNMSWKEFRAKHDAIFVSPGAQKVKMLGIPGEEVDGVLDVLDFLEEVKYGGKPRIGNRVGIVGGGDAAIDAARTAYRLGAESVTILYRRTREEMPADVDDIKEALNEGIQIEFLVAPVRVISESNKMTGVEFIRMSLGDVDRSGRRRPVAIEGSEFTIELDSLIPAIGQDTNLDFLPDQSALNVTDWNTIKVNQGTMQSDDPTVFAGGDVVTGPATVIEAMGAGKRAARSIHTFLRGEAVEPLYQKTAPDVLVDALELSDEDTDLIPEDAPEMPTLPLGERTGNFREVELGLSRERAVWEARRCLRCDLR